MSVKRGVVELGLAALCATVAIATLIEPQWFELLFDATPDGGGGSLETLVVVGLFGLAAAAFAARPLWRWWSQRRVAASKAEA